MLRKLASAFTAAFTVLLSVAFFAALWPLFVLWFIDQSGVNLGEPIIPPDQYAWAFGLMALVGLFVGADAGLQFTAYVIRIDSRKARLFFLRLSIAFLISLVVFDFYELALPRDRGFSVRQLDYILAVEGLPILWFAYHARAHIRSKRRRMLRQRLR